MEKSFYDRLVIASKTKGTSFSKMVARCSGTRNLKDLRHNWHRRRYLPRADVAMKMADELGVSLYWLLFGIQDPNHGNHVEEMHIPFDELNVGYTPGPEKLREVVKKRIKRRDA